MSSPSKRREMDLMKLMITDHEVEMIDDGMQEFYVLLHGPKESPYQGGVWKIRVELPDAYPYKSPSIGFVNKIYHPNVDEMSGSVCLDVINQAWSPMSDLMNVFEVFLPQLLLYPNASDPLNMDAAALMICNRNEFDQRVEAELVESGFCSYYYPPRSSNFPFASISPSSGTTGRNKPDLNNHFHHTAKYCEKYAKPSDVGVAAEEKSSNEELSEDEYVSSDDEVA